MQKSVEDDVTAQSSVAEPWRGVVSSYIDDKRAVLPYEHSTFGEVLVKQNDNVEAFKIRRRQSSFSGFPSAIVEIPAERRAHEAPQPKTNANELLTAYKTIDLEKDTFRAAVEEFKSTAVAKKRKLVLIDPLSKDHTWSSVVATVKNAAEERYKSSSTAGKVAKTISRFLRNNAEALDNWKDLLPSGSEYFSIICGFLKLVFGAAAALGDVAEEINKAVEKIPETIDRALSLLALFQAYSDCPQTKLEGKCATLMASIFALMNEVLHELGKNWFSRELKAFVQQERYTHTIKEASLQVDNDAKRFQDMASDYGLALGVNTNATAHRIEDTVYRIEQGDLAGRRRNEDMLVHIGQRLSSAMRRGQEDQYELASLSEQQQVARFRQQELNMREHLRIIQEQSDAIRELKGICMDMLASDPLLNHRSGGDRYIEQDHELVKRLKSDQRDKQAASLLSQDILGRLDFDSAIAVKDEAAVFTRSINMNSKKQDRAIAILQHKSFQAWVLSKDSSVMSVNARCSNALEDEPTAYASMKLRKAIAPAQRSSENDQSQTICLSFFCGLHTTSKDAIAGPAGMMRYLIGQLLSQYTSFSLAMLESVLDIDREDPQELFRTLEGLLQELPSRLIVFLIVDCVVKYEGIRAYMADTARLIDSLLSLIGNEQIRAKLKVLFTNPVESQTLRAAQDGIEHIEVRTVPTTAGLLHTTLIDTMNRPGDEE